MKRNLLLLFALCVGRLCAAQADTLSTGFICGTVTDRKTGESMAFTTVCIVELKQCVTTGENGYYTFKDFPTGRYTVTSRSVGYEPAEETVKVCLGEVAKQNIALRFNGPQLCAPLIKAVHD